MLCFRYEDALGVGPYTQSPSITRTMMDDEGWVTEKAINHAHNNSNGRPSPFEREEPADDVYNVRGNYIFACKDEKTFRTWFWGWHEVCQQRGQRLVIHDVPDELVHVGKSGQVMYRREYVAAVVDYAEVRFERICRKSPQRLGGVTHLRPQDLRQRFLFQGAYEMGYTHYWRKSVIPTVEQWEHMLNLFTVMLADPECPMVAYESDEIDRPVRADAAGVWFNGIGSDGRETFCVERERVSEFDFCKTARKPYDDLVTGTLIAMRVVFGPGFNLSSDGNGGGWQAGIDLYNRAASAMHDQYKVDTVDAETVQAFIEEEHEGKRP